MKLGDLDGWHSLTYSQLYPAVLGSMLYGVLRLPSVWTIKETLALSVTALLIVDYLHLYRDLQMEKKARWLETAIDAAVAVLLGIAFWKIDDGQNAAAAVFIGITLGLFFVYNLVPSRRDPIKLLVLTIMGVAAIVMNRLAASDASVDSIARAAWIIPGVYALYVFTRANSKQKAAPAPPTGVPGAAA